MATKPIVNPLDYLGINKLQPLPSKKTVSVPTQTPVPAYVDPKTGVPIYGEMAATATVRSMADGPLTVDSSGEAVTTPVPPTAPSANPNINTSDRIDVPDKTLTIDEAIAKALKESNAAWQAKYDALTSQNTATNRANTTTALQDFTASLNAAGLGDLVTTLNTWITQDKTSAQIAMDIKKEPSYKLRFPGMDKLAAAGKAVNEATYISMERGMIGILKAYGLDDKVFGTTAKLGDVIGGLVSVTEYETRVSNAADHVQKNPDVLAALHDYYGVDTAGAISYLLDPATGMDIVKKQVRAAEIGAAGRAAGFKTFESKNFGVAESFINIAGTADLNALKESFGKARVLADTQARLSGIEGKTYNELDAVTATLGDQAQQLESQKRAAREAARFGGQGSNITRVASGI